MSKKIKNVLLIFPPFLLPTGSYEVVTPPLGLAYIASAIKDDFNVKILDCVVEGFKHRVLAGEKRYRHGLKMGKIKEEIRIFTPDVVGISCLFSSQFIAAQSICKEVKFLNKEIVTVIGGSHPTFLARECMRDTDIDFIVLGEGESSFKELLSRLNLSRSVYDLDGIAWRNGKEIIVNKKNNFIRCLDDISFPARQLIPMEEYYSINRPPGHISKTKRNTTLITSRGCLEDCQFCSSSNYWGRRYRVRTTENVLNEIEELIKKFSIREVQFIDDNLTQDKKRTVELFEGMIKRKFNIHWNMPNGVAAWTLDEKLLELMKESGCYELTLGIESANKRILETFIGKPVNLIQVKEIVKVARKIGIDTNSFFILGFPGETEAEINETLSFAESLGLDRAWFLFANFLPGSTLSEIYKDKFNNDFKFENNNYSVPGFLFGQNNDKLRKKIVKKMKAIRIKAICKKPIRHLDKYKFMVLHSVWHHLYLFIVSFKLNFKRIRQRTIEIAVITINSQKKIIHRIINKVRRLWLSGRLLGYSFFYFKSYLTVFYQLLIFSSKRWSRRDAWSQLHYHVHTRKPDWLPRMQDSLLKVCTTYKCNLSCKYCYARDFKEKIPNDMTLNDFYRLLIWAKKNKWNRMVFLGGEPTLHPDFSDMLKLCYKHKMFITIATNNVFPSRIISNVKSFWHENVIVNYNARQVANSSQQRFFDRNLKEWKARNISFGFSYIIGKDKEDLRKLFFDVEYYKPTFVRTSLALPDSSKQNLGCNIFDYSQHFFRQIMQIQKECVRLRIPFYNYRPIPVCMFSDKEWKKLKEISPYVAYTRCPIGYKGRYTYMLTVNPDLSFSFCYSVFMKNENILKFKNRKELNAFLKKNTAQLISNCLIESCNECLAHDLFMNSLNDKNSQKSKDFFSQRVCQGGCLNLRWHNQSSCFS